MRSRGTANQMRAATGESKKDRAEQHVQRAGVRYRYPAFVALLVALWGVGASWGDGHAHEWFSRHLALLNTSTCIALLAGGVLCSRHRLLSRLLIVMAGLLAGAEWLSRAGLFLPGRFQDAFEVATNRHFLSGGATTPIVLVLLVFGMAEVRLRRVDLSQLSLGLAAVLSAIFLGSRSISAVLPTLSAPPFGMSIAGAIGVLLLVAAVLMQRPQAPIARILTGSGADTLTMKIGAPLTALVVVAFASVASVFVTSMHRSIDDQLINESRLAMASVRGLISGSTSNADTQRGLDEILHAGRIADAVIVDTRTRRVVVSSNRDWLGMPMEKLPWEYFGDDITSAIATGKEQIDIDHEDGKLVDITAFIARPTLPGAEDAPVGMVAMLHIKADEIRKRAAMQAWQLGLLSVVVLTFIIAIGAYLVRRRLLDRISTASDVIVRWSEGNHGSRVPPSPKDELGRIGGALNRMFDTVDAQRQQISLLATVSRRTSNGVVILDIDDRIIWANDAFTRMSGYSPAEYLTKHLSEVMFSERTDPFTVSRLHQAMAAYEGIRVEALLCGKGAYEYWVEMDLQPMRNEAGKVDGFILLQTDIDARKLAEIELDYVRGHLYTAIETIDASMIMFDKDARFVMCNSVYREANCAWAGVLVRGTPFAKISESFYLKHPHLMEGRSMEDCVAQDLERFRDGVSTWTVYLGDRYIRLASRKTPDGGFVCLGTDVTEMELIHAELQAAFHAAESANRTKTEFLANMSHEIRSPMSAIMGYAEMLEDDQSLWENPEERHRSIEVIRRSGEHLLTIINDILDLSKIEAGKMTIEKVRFCPALIVSNVLELYGVTAKAKNLDMTSVYETPIPEEIEGDPVRTQQVVSNLLSNALKFTRTGGVSVVMRLDNPVSSIPVLKISVRDTGIGMTPEQVSRLFRAFEQAESSTARRYGGSGLGLRISKRLAELMGGDVSADSQIGEGSEFTFSLPVAREDTKQLFEPSTHLPDNAAKEVSKTSASTPLLSGVRILLMEDSQDDRMLIKRLLENAGAIVTAAEDGSTGLASMFEDGDPDGVLMRPDPFDLIVLDVQMPEMDGFQVATRLRERSCRIPIVAVTADTIAGTADRCADAGCNDFVAKPVDRATLLDACVRAANVGSSGHAAESEHDELTSAPQTAQ